MKSRNFSSDIITLTSSTADTEFSAAHSLMIGDVPTIPVAYIILSRSGASSLYLSTTTWTTTTVYFKSDVANSTFTILLFA